MIDVGDDRAGLAATLRDLRENAGLSTHALARRLGWSQSKVSKTELGRTIAPAEDVVAWADATGADAATRDRLVLTAERLAAQVTEWRRELAPGRRRLQEDIHRLEAAASVVRVFAPVLVPGLAQTRDYAEAALRLTTRDLGAENIAEVVQARLNRQRVLEDPNRAAYLLMGEAALWRRLVPAEARRAQLAKLVELSEQHHLIVGVIPLDADQRVHQYGGFTVLGDPEVDEDALVRVSQLTRSITIRARREVLDYIEHFEQLRRASLEGTAFRAFVRELITRRYHD